MKKIVILFSSTLIMLSCKTVIIPPYTPVPIGVIATENVEIRAEDGSFTLVSGETWIPPFQWKNAPPNNSFWYGSDMTALYKVAISQMGAKKVRVKVPYIKKELYGVLSLSGIYPSSQCSSAVTRSYQISIPKDYVDKASNGGISVLYEYYNCGFPDFAGKSFRAKTWILWLSDIPFN